MLLVSSVLALVLAAPPAGHATVATRFTAPARLTVGDPFDVTLVLRAPRPSLVTGPLLDSLGTFLVVGEKRSVRRLENDDETTYRVRVACYRPGRHRFPGFTFLVSAGQRADTLRTDTLSVSVASVLAPKLGDIRPLKPAEGFPNRMLWLIPALLALAAALVWLGLRLARRLKAATEAGTPLLPPWEEALASLEQLPWREWLAEGQVKRFTYALSEILKRYLERRFEFAAVEQTTTEILASMRSLRLPMRDELARFFTRSDLVKYSKWVPPVEESEQAIEQVREFVLQTKPANQAVAAPAGAAEPGGGPAAAAGATERSRGRGAQAGVGGR